MSLLQQYGEDEEEEDDDVEGAEGEESNEGSGDVHEPFEGEDTEVYHALFVKNFCADFHLFSALWL